MSRHYSRREKGKWVAESRTPTKRSPVRIPESNKEDLITANALTIIGRVTNTQIQRPRAVVDFLPQVWNLEGRVTGRALGVDKFQFKFVSEEDLVMVLRKGPYHYKKWMLLIQKWEPIVSAHFPSTISFWINIHGIPLHFWNEKTIDSIGDALGNCPERDFDGARLRIDANGLQPLEMTRDILLPTGEVTEVEFEYIKLEKHCFQCHSLLHEKDDCPSVIRGDRPTKLGINQRNALMRIEADKRRHDERRGYSRHQETRRSTDGDYTRRDSDLNGRRRSDQPRSDHRSSYRSDTLRSHHYGRSTQRYPELSRSLSEHTHRPRKVTASKRTITGTSRELGRNLNARLGTIDQQAGENWSQASHTPPPRHPDQQQHSIPSGNSKERRSALDRISEPRVPVQARLGGTSSLDSTRLQEVEIQFLGDEDQELLTRRLSHTSPVIPDTQLNAHVEVAEDDELSEDLAPRRIHPSLRIEARVNPPASEKRKAPSTANTSVNASKSAAKGASKSAVKKGTKATGKPKNTKPVRRVPHSPLGEF
ncbi:hypothetical protein Bca4012_021881 [Brassica carinata]